MLIRIPEIRWLVLTTVAIGLLSNSGSILAETARQTTQTSTARTPPAGKKQFAFRGTVEKVDAATGAIVVNNENIPGWMGQMSMGYRVSNPAVLGSLKVGDRITATVYEGDVNTLYDVRLVTGGATTTSARNELPPLSYVCPSAGEEGVLEDKPGKCPKSGQPLVPIRLVIAYSCLRGPAIISATKGTCAYDRSEMQPITTSEFWACGDDPSKRYLEPGTCSNGVARQAQFEKRPHGDHNPRHGGTSVFMSTDLRHHVEATFVAPGIFRIYFYDEYTRPMRVADFPAGFSARVARADSNAIETGESVVLTPLTTADGNVMEARVPSIPAPTAAAPVYFKLRVKLMPSDKDWVTDHAFAGYSKEP